MCLDQRADLRVLADAGLVRPAATRTVRGGTEQYYRHASRGLRYDDAATTQTAFRALAAEIAAAQPEPFLVLRTLSLTPAHAEQLIATLRDLAGQADDGDGQPRYGLLLGLYQPAQPTPGNQEARPAFRLVLASWPTSPRARRADQNAQPDRGSS